MRRVLPVVLALVFIFTAAGCAEVNEPSGSDSSGFESSSSEELSSSKEISAPDAEPLSEPVLLYSAPDLDDIRGTWLDSDTVIIQHCKNTIDEQEYLGPVAVDLYLWDAAGEPAPTELRDPFYSLPEEYLQYTDGSFRAEAWREDKPELLLYGAELLVRIPLGDASAAKVGEAEYQIIQNNVDFREISPYGWAALYKETSRGLQLYNIFTGEMCEVIPESNRPMVLQHYGSKWSPDGTAFACWRRLSTRTGDSFTIQIYDIADNLANFDLPWPETIYPVTEIPSAGDDYFWSADGASIVQTRRYTEQDGVGADKYYTGIFISPVWPESKTRDLRPLEHMTIYNVPADNIALTTELDAALYIEGNVLWRYDLETGEAEKLAAIPEGAGNSFGGISVSPDASKVVFYGETDSEKMIYFVDISG